MHAVLLCGQSQKYFHANKVCLICMHAASHQSAKRRLIDYMHVKARIYIRMYLCGVAKHTFTYTMHAAVHQLANGYTHVDVCARINVRAHVNERIFIYKHTCVP